MSFGASTSLCPGYKQVEEFGPDDDYEDEEVVYVTLDLGNVEPTLVPSAAGHHLIGLDTPTPFLQLQGTVLKGRHDQLLGTELIFTEDKDAQKRSVNHVANTEQRISFKEVTLRRRSSSPDAKGKEKAIPEEEEEEQAEVSRDASNLMSGEERIDRITGKTAPPTRAPRTKKSAKGKKAMTSPESSKSKSKQKGKGKAKAPSDDAPQPDDAPDDDDRMDVGN